MRILKFNTSISCGGCLEKVTPVLNSLSQVANWEVDLSDPNKVLTVQGSEVTSELISQALIRIGYVATVIDAAKE